MADYDEDEDEPGPAIKEYTLAERTELRLECDDQKDVLVELLEGSAEIFGCELQLGSKINVKGQKLPVFTWRGCKLRLEGRPTMCYEAPDTPMSTYLELHARLNTQREAARTARASLAGASAEDLPQGPRVIIVGPTDSGKSSLSRCLLNWATRSGWEPTYVDLDVGQGTITAPGCLAAVPIETPLDPEEGAAALDMPLVMFYGHAAANDNPELYKFLIDRLAAVLDRRAACNALAAESGLVINTLGWTDGLGYELQLHAILAFKADVVLVLDQDRLHSQLSAELKGRQVQVLKLPKSGGVVKRERDERKTARDKRLKDYFYGPKLNLMPTTQTLKCDQLKVFRIGGGPRAPTSALPIGAVASAADPLKVTHVPVTAELTQGLLAISHAETPDQVLTSNVAGFILIKDVDTLTNRVTFVAPCPGTLPGRYLLSGSIRSVMD